MNRLEDRKMQDSRLILDAFRKIVQAIQQSSKNVDHQFGVSGAQLFVLHKASELESSSINDLAEKTLTHQSSVSVVVEKLVRKGLVCRMPDPLDRRKVRVQLTKEGRILVKKAPLAPQEELTKGILSLPDRDRRRLAQGLAKLLDVTGYASSTPNLLFEKSVRDRRKSKN